MRGTCVWVILLAVQLASCETIVDKHLRGNALDVKHDYYRSSSSSKRDDGISLFIIGCLLFIASFPILWFNERRYVINKYRITHAFDACRIVSSAEVDPNCDNQLVFTSGKAMTNDIVMDTSFAVSEANCIKIVRYTEMLQWVEHLHERDNRTYYDYNLEWKSTFIDSNHFSQAAGHENDKAKWVVQTQTFLTPTVYLGQYQLSDSLKSQTENEQVIPLNQHNVELAKQNYGIVHQSIQLSGSQITFQLNTSYQHSGDLRVQFKKVPCEDLSVVSQQHGITFQPWTIHDKYEEPGPGSQQDGQLREAGFCKNMCEEIKKLEKPMDNIDWIFEQILTKVQAFNKKLDENKILTIVLRFAGWLMMGFGLCCFFSPISEAISYFPFFGPFLASITGLIFGILSFSIATPLALITIAIAWLWYRPAVGIFLIAISGAIFAGIYLYVHFHMVATKQTVAQP